MSLKSIKTVFIFMLTMITINMTYAQPNSCDCDFNLDIVCVVDDVTGNIVSFPNACFAECEGFTAADFVNCSSIFIDSTITTIDTCGCSFDFDPVCVDGGNGNFFPFPNACLAACEGFSIVDIVECDFGGIDTTIVTTDTTTIDTCGCSFDFDPVCVDDGNGNFFPFPNSCLAACAGFTVADFVNCDSIIFPLFDYCSASFWYNYDYTDPLSVQFSDYSSTATSWAWDFGDGNTSTEQNPLHVYSEEGVYDVTLTIVGDSCTSTIVKHICIFSVGDGGGVIDTTDVCGCTFDFDPVCVNDGNGNIIPFPNACIAECEGFAVADFVDCDLFDIIDSQGNQVNFSVSNLSAYPNPASDILNIFLIGNSDTEKEYRFSIQNIAGSTISSSSRVVYKGENTVQFDVSSLHSGLYFMEIQNGEEIKTIKFMK